MTNRGSSTGGSSPRSVHSSSRRRKSRNRRSHPRSRSRSSSYSQSRSRSRSISRSSSFRSRSRSRSRRRWSGSRSHSRSRYARHSRSGSRSSSYDRRRPSRRSRSRSQFSTRSHSAERSLSPVNEKGRDPRDRSKRVAWRNSVYIVGEKAKDITFHYCEVCDLPIVLYGRLLPCKHVLCYTCASSLPNGKCNRCQKPVKTVDRFQIGRIFMCSKSDGCCRTYLSQRDLQAHIIHRHRDGSTAPANATTAEKTEVTQCTSQGEITRPSAPIQSVPLTTFNPIGFAATNRAPGLLPMPPQGSTTPLTNPISVPHLVRPPPTSASIPILQFTSPPPSSQAPPIDPMSLPPLGIMNTSIPPPTGPAAPVLNSANPLALLAAAVSQTKPPGLNIPPPANANTNPNWSQPTMMNNIRLSGTLPTNNPGQLNRGRFPSHCKYLP